MTMRDEDSSLAKDTSEELRDIHKRLDVVVERIHDLEVTVARGGRFPAWAGGLVVLAIMQIGGQVYLNAELKGDIRRASEIALESHECANNVPVLTEKVSTIEETLRTRLVGNTADGWHRRDHDLYAEAINRRFELLEEKIRK